MGLSSSTLANTDVHDHFADIVNPKKAAAAVKEGHEPENERKLAKLITSRDTIHAGSFDALPIPPPTSSSTGVGVNSRGQQVVYLDSRAGIVKKLDAAKLWSNFLHSSALSFALPHSEVFTLLMDSCVEDAFPEGPRRDAGIEECINKYLELVSELTGGEATPRTFDFMAIMSSILFFAPRTIEDKIDQIYEWVTLNDGAESFGFNEFYVALSSFERGLSHAIGKKSLGEDAIKQLTGNWLALADPTFQGSSSNREEVTISRAEFYDFCSNRQHVVRRLLECLGISDVVKDDNQNITEAVVMAEENALLENAPSGGDQWMASPAWKKTAEKMLPKNIQHIDTKPSTVLELEWVHGYRGYDCRNNLKYLDNGAKAFSYHAAALSISYVKDTDDDKKQVFFGEHSDDIISHALCLSSPGSGNSGPPLIATGEIGKKPAIYIYSWSIETHSFSPITSMRGYHKNGVCQMAFAKDGSSIFTVSVDYSIAVYCTKMDDPNMIGKMICSSKGPKDRILDCCALRMPGDNGGDMPHFVTCGEKHISYWSSKGKNISQKEVRLGSFKRDFVMCATAVAGYKQCAAGTSGGNLLYVQSETLMKELCIKDLHRKAINSIHSVDDGKILITGGADGKICVLRISGLLASDADIEINILRRFNVYGSASLSHRGRAPPIRSVCMSADFTKLLVGTQASEIIEITSDSAIPLVGEGGVNLLKMKEKDVKNNVKPEARGGVKENILVVGHYKEELWGLAIRPGEEREYCTVGDDGFLRVWDIATRKQKQFLDMGPSARCCDYSPDGIYLAVGFGGSRADRKNKHNGAVRIYRADTDPMLQVCELKEAKQWISKVKFSPDGSILGVGSRDNSIYTYSVAQQFKRKSKFSKHNAGILDFDFSEDGKYVQSTCSAYELLFSDPSNGAQLASGTTLLANEKWKTMTCSLGWSVMGIWSGTMDGSDVNSVDRSNDNGLLAVGDDSSKVKVYRYPATLGGKDGAPHHEYLGHSSHVTMVRWVSDQYLISTGGNDKCVFQWKALAGGDKAGTSIIHSSNEEEGEVEEVQTSLDFGPSGGDEFTAVKPWLGAIHAPMAWSNKDPAKLPPFFAALGELSSLHSFLRPNLAGREAEGDPEEASSFVTKMTVSKTAEIYQKYVSAASEVNKSMSCSGVDNNTQPDGDELELEWVHGYRGFDCRNNVHYINEGARRSIVYHAASLGIMLTIQSDGTSKQSYFRGHNDDITAISLFSAQNDYGETRAHLVATGQQGKGKTFVWEAPSMKTLAILFTGQKTISQIAFGKAHGGRIIVTISEDKSVVVSDWKSQSILSKTKGDGADCYHVCTASSALSEKAFQFLTVGNKFVTYWTLNGRNLTSKKVSTAKPGTKFKKYLNMKFVSCAEIGEDFFIGAEDGNIYQFTPGKKGSHALVDCFAACTDDSDASALKGRSGMTGAAKQKNKSSKCYVFALHVLENSSYGNLLLAGTSKGDVSIFKLDEGVSTRQSLGTFNVNDLMPSISARQVYTLSLKEIPDRAGVFVLVGTRGCDLFEVMVPTAGDALNVSAAALVSECKNEDVIIPDNNVGVLNRGHCNGEVWGLACHPLIPEYITVGDDMSLRCYNVSTRKVHFVLPLGAVARACAYNATGSMVAVGFGGCLGRGKEPKGGMVRIYGRNSYPEEGPNQTCLQSLCEVRDAKQWISDVKWSSDSSTLCVAAHDCKIYIYDVTYTEIVSGSPHLPVATKASLTLRTTFRKHSAAINHIDISSEGRYMQSNCSAYELLFCDIGTGKQVTKSSQLKDVDWDTWSCTLGWPVQGIWQSGMDGSDINATARSHSGHLLATADDNGQVHLFRYPVLQKGAAYLSYTGHSSHVTNVRWTAADETLVSAGGADKCIFQWKHVMNEAAGEAHDGEDEESSDIDAPASVSEDIALMTGPSGGDESGAVKPWLGAIRAPSNPPHIDHSEPAVDMSLSWVHGYTAGNRCNTRMGSNLFYAADGEPIYPAASLGVRLNRDTNGGPFKQTYFRGHDDDILCLAVSLDRRFVATGQTPSHTSKGMGSICVWSACDCRLLARMDKCHQRGVYSLAFNREGTELVSVGQDNKNVHKLWSDLGGNWSRVQCTASATSDQSTIYFSHWLHADNPSGCQIVTGGAKAINFWKLEGATLVKKQGRFGRKYKQAPLLCVANIQTKDEKGGQMGWQTVAGTSKGDFYVFDEREVCNTVQGAHIGAVLSLAEGNERCDFIVSGGADKHIRVWNQALQGISSFDLSANCIVDASVASLDVRPDLASDDESCLRILVGSYGGDIFEVSSTPQPVKKDNVRSLDITSPHLVPLVTSHSKGELWGLSPHPTNPDLYCTVGDDGTLRIWSIKKQRMIAYHNIGYRCRSVAWGPVLPVPANADELTAGEEATVMEDVIAVGLDSAEKRRSKRKKSHKGAKEAFTKGSAAGGDEGRHAVRLLSVSGLSSDGGSGKVTIREIARGCDDTSCISDIKFSPRDDITAYTGRVRLGVSSHNAKLYVFNLPDHELDIEGEGWADCLDDPAIFAKHSSTVTHFDFNIDGTHVQSNCQAGELLFSEIYEDAEDRTKIKQITRASNMADYNGVYDPKLTEDGLDESASKKWATQTCHLGWPVQGIWAPGIDTSDINTCDRNFSEELLATGDDFSYVKVFRYPVVEEGSKFLALEGHSSHVTSVRWASGGHLLSTGGNDNCIFVWHAEKL